MEFEEFFGRYYPDVRRRAARLFGEDDADDIAQETMLRAFSRFDQLTDGRPVWTWLTTVADNVGRDHIRRTSRTIAASDAVSLDEPVVADDSASVAIAVDVRPVLGRALRRLTDRDRHAITMHTVAGAAIGEIAAESGVSANAMRQRLFRARRALHRHYLDLGGREYGLPPMPFRMPDLSRPGVRRAVAAAAVMVAATLTPSNVAPPATPAPGSADAAPLEPAVVDPAPAEPPATGPAVGAPSLPEISLPEVPLDLMLAGTRDRVEAETGVFNPLCGDSPMSVYENPHASGGRAVFYSGDGCKVTYVAVTPMRITSVRFRSGGRDGLICGRFRVTGAITGESERVCGGAAAWRLVAVVTTTGVGAYDVIWHVDGNEPWLDASVDWLGITAAAAVAQCDDGRDNDGDGTADGGDGACHDAFDDDERSEGPCDDGLDNDGDGAIDFGADRGCGTWADPTEYCAVNGTATDAFTVAARCIVGSPGDLPPLP